MLSGMIVEHLGHWLPPEFSADLQKHPADCLVSKEVYRNPIYADDG